MAKLPESLEALYDKIERLLAKNQWDECIDACTEFLRLAENETAVSDTVKAMVYLRRAAAYSNKRDIPRAIVDYTKSLELDSENAPAYYSRGSLHALNGEFGKALEDLRNASEHAPEFARTYALCRIASKTQSSETFEHLFKVLACVFQIKAALIHPPTQPPKPVFHYTEMNILKKLVEGEKFRLYNADYMNDPEEGEIFWEIIKEVSDHDFREEVYPNESEESLSPAYVGSFVRMKGESESDATEKHGSKDGELFLWRTYGKNAGVEAAGACLHFDISKFSETPVQNFGQMPSTNEECIYKVVYANEITPLEKCIDEYKIVLAYLTALANELAYIAQVPEEEKKDAFRLAGELLGEIRFLFKVGHYQNERELRIVQARYTSAPMSPGESDAESENEESDVKADENHQPPHIYLEAKNLDLKGVTLGPMTQNALEWTHWLKWKNRDLKIHHSKIRYGKK